MCLPPPPQKKTNKQTTTQSLETFVTNIDKGQEGQQFPYHGWRYPDFLVQLDLLLMDVSRYHVMLKCSLA